ncbi:hypothetical protein EON62_01295, partial [archaeon]
MYPCGRRHEIIKNPARRNGVRTPPPPLLRESRLQSAAHTRSNLAAVVTGACPPPQGASAHDSACTLCTPHRKLDVPPYVPASAHNGPPCSRVAPACAASPIPPTHAFLDKSLRVRHASVLNRSWWSVCHALVAGYTLWSASGSLALTALSHLILYDAFGAMLCVAVDVLGNFEVWRRSSIRHPFGLERAEVLAGFAMSVLLLFMGMDLISHNLT